MNSHKATPDALDATPNATSTGWSRPLTRGVLLLIRAYQRYVSVLTPPSCRFEPSCSHYTYAAIERFGLWRGAWLGLKRVCRCNPWNAGGLDPVPLCWPSAREESQDQETQAAHDRKGV